jgi:hypothetical protein
MRVLLRLSEQRYAASCILTSENAPSRDWKVLASTERRPQGPQFDDGETLVSAFLAAGTHTSEARKPFSDMLCTHSGEEKSG